MSTNSKKSTVDLYKIIAQNIRKLIEAMEWNQKKFADATGISEPALSNYMKNLKESENSPKKDEEDSDKKNNDNKRLPSVDYLYNLTRTQAFHDAGIVFTIDEFLSESFNPVTSEKRKRTISRTNTVGQTFTGNYICYLFDQSKPINEFDFKHARELRYGVITVYGTFTANGIYENRVVARFFKKEEYTDAIRLKKDLDEIFIKNKDDMQNIQAAIVQKSKTYSDLYTGDFKISGDKSFINIKSETHEDTALIILYATQKKKDSSYKGGCGCVVSVSHGSERMPTAQKIIFSRYEIKHSNEDIAEHLSMSSAPISPTGETEELCRLCSKLYGVKEQEGFFLDDYDKNALVKNRLIRLIRNYIEKNICSVASVSRTEDDIIYKWIKDSIPKNI